MNKSKFLPAAIGATLLLTQAVSPYLAYATDISSTETQTVITTSEIHTVKTITLPSTLDYKWSGGTPFGDITYNNIISGENIADRSICKEDFNIVNNNKDDNITFAYDKETGKLIVISDCDRDIDTVVATWKDTDNDGILDTVVFDISFRVATQTLPKVVYNEKELVVKDKDGNVVDSSSKVAKELNFEIPEGIEISIDKDGNLIVADKTGKGLDNVNTTIIDSDGDGILDTIIFDVTFKDGDTADGKDGKKASSSTIPKTGDNSLSLALATSAVGVGAIMIGMASKTKKDKEEV